jgi:hypothetical protein
MRVRDDNLPENFFASLRFPLGLQRERRGKGVMKHAIDLGFSIEFLFMATGPRARGSRTATCRGFAAFEPAAFGGHANPPRRGQLALDRLAATLRASRHFIRTQQRLE